VSGGDRRVALTRRRLAVLAAAAFGSWPTRAFASTEAIQVADALFDLYLDRSIQLSVFNARRARADADQILAPRLPAMRTVLGRHRAAFTQSMRQAMEAQMSPAVVRALAQRLPIDPGSLDEATRAELVAVDTVFRRESQAVIRAITADLGAMIEETLTRGS
jgi:hypothetical protein